MRLLPIVLLFASLLACDDFGEVQRADDIATYEAWLKENPESRKVFEANLRLEELYLNKARADKTLESWDAYLARWPKGRQHDAALEEREEFLFKWAQKEATGEAWKKWLDEYPKGFSKHRRIAQAAAVATNYATSMEFGEVRTRKINLAEDPNGPLNGTEFAMDVTNKGVQTLAAYVLEIHYLNDQGRTLDKRQWPVVGDNGDFKVPVEEFRKVPLKPGETREWLWWADTLPEGFSGKVKIVPVRARFVKK